MRLSQKQYDMLRMHSLSRYPEEACALIVGRGDRAEEIVLAPNIAENPKRFFEIDPSARIQTEKKCRHSGQTIIGVFHSHPDGEAKPSNADANMVIERNFIWLIASLNGADEFHMGAFLPFQNGAGFTPVSLKIEEK